MKEEKEECTDTPPSHILYEGKNMIYIKNKISSNTLAISRNNLDMNNISFKTLQNLSDFTSTKIYGILGIVNFQNTPCMVFGTEFDVLTFYLDKAVYKIKNINYIILKHSEKNLNQEIDKEFKIFRENILKVNLIFSNYINLTIPFSQQNSHNINEFNLFFYNYEMITPFLLNNNIKNKNEFYTAFIEGDIKCYSHDLSGQQMILYILYRKNVEMNFYESEITINYSTDAFNYIYGIKIGNEKFKENFIKDFERKTGIIFNCANNEDGNEYKKNLPYFNYIKYDKTDFNEKSIEKFFEDQNKEIKKTQYYYTSKDPITGKVKGKYRQQESIQNG